MSKKTLGESLISVTNGTLINLKFPIQSSKVHYDISDVQGRLIKTGSVDSKRASIPTDGLSDDSYILLLIDGNRLYLEHLDLEEKSA